jgi:hypothetical protein
LRQKPEQQSLLMPQPNSPSVRQEPPGSCAQTPPVQVFEQHCDAAVQVWPTERQTVPAVQTPPAQESEQQSVERVQPAASGAQFSVDSQRRLPSGPSWQLRKQHSELVVQVVPSSLQLPAGMSHLPATQEPEQHSAFDPQGCAYERKPSSTRPSQLLSRPSQTSALQGPTEERVSSQSHWRTPHCVAVVFVQAQLTKPSPSSSRAPKLQAPVAGLHVSVVQALLSLQTTVVPAVQMPVWQVETPLQRLLSVSQLVPFVTGVRTQPEVGLQVSVVQTLLSLQLSAVPALQTPDGLQISLPLQTSPSLHDVPTATGVFTQPPCALQESAVHGLLSLQVPSELQPPCAVQVPVAPHAVQV